MEERYEREWDRKMDPHWRGKGRGSKKFGHQERHRSNESGGNADAASHRGRGERDGERIRHPPGLKGKEIGLWYARQSRGKKNNRERNEEYKNRAVITMDRRQEQRLSNLLKDIQSSEISPQKQRSYKIPSMFDDDEDDDEDDKDKRVRNSDETFRLRGASKFDSRDVHLGSKGRFHSSASAVDYFEFTGTDQTASAAKSGQGDFTDDLEVLKFSDEKDACLSSKRKCWSHNTPSQSYASQTKNPVNRYVPNFDEDEEEEEDGDADVQPEEEYGSAAAGSEMSDFIDETTGLEFEEECKEEDETDSGLISLNREEEEETSNFMFEFYKEQKESESRAYERQDYQSIIRDKDLDRMLINQQKMNTSKDAFQKMLHFRQKLPCYNKRQEILDTISKNQVVVISGETGCGKTTQVTQFILDSFIEKGDGSLCRIVCTQPRRISAISIAERVAEERAESLGISVGYQIRLEQNIPRNQGSILYCTTGIMLKWLESDPLLANTSHIILDEVHERDILCDFLMIILRDLVQRRRNLKLILMSATLNAELFSEYFGNCPMLHIPGYTFPVKEYFLEDIIEMMHFKPKQNPRKKSGFQFLHKNMKEEQKKMNDYKQWISRLNRSEYCRNTIDVLERVTFDTNEIDYDLLTRLIHFIVLNRPDGAILVFVPGWDQIRKVMDSLRAESIFNSDNFRIIPLHSLMPTVNQKEVFERPPQGKRKIIVATNIAETSITIDDVVYVIDCGTTKMKNFDVTNNLSTLQPEWISRANAQQRRGRAGRVCAGECFHLYTTFHENCLEDFQQPEMLRTRLEELCLQIKLLKLGKIKTFVAKAMQPPSLDSLDLAIRVLRDLNALDVKEELTPLGYHLAKMPVDPHSGKMLLFAALFSCLEPILTIAASLSFKNAFYVPMGHEHIADERKRELSNKTKSDHLLLVNAFKGWERAKAERRAYEYCRRNYLSHNTLQLLHNMRRQFSQLLHEMGFLVSSDPKTFESNMNSDNLNLVKAIVCAGLYPNVARLRPIKNIHSKRPLVLDTKCDQRVSVHPKSVNFTEREFSSQWFIYHLKMMTKKIYLYDCSPVSPYPLLFFGGEISFKKDLGQNCVVVDDWIKFGASRRVANLVLELRHEFDRLMERRVTKPCTTDWNKKTQEGALMHAILDLLTNDDSCVPNFTKQH